MISIIIPCKTYEESIPCVAGCFKQSYNNYEVIVIPDFYTKQYSYENLMNDRIYKNKLFIHPSGEKIPSHKRDLGIKYSHGNIIAFIDSDAVPANNWLFKIKFYLDYTPGIVGVCGPGILPFGSSPLQICADKILKMLPMKYRVTHGKRQLVSDYPTFNLAFYKYALLKANCFSCDFVTGEDTLLCRKVIEKNHAFIQYSPDVVVFHQRRKLFRPFLRQIATYAIHRGYFFKKGIGDSRKCVYIAPSLLLLTLSFLLAWFLLF